MAERASVFETIQIGPEVTPGTGVAALKRLLCTSIEPTPSVPLTPYRPTGNKYPTTETREKEMTNANIAGVVCYHDLNYLLASLMCVPTISTPGGATNTRRWRFFPKAWAPDTIQTYTIQHGSTLFSEQFTYGLVNALTMRFTKTEASISGSMIGQNLVENVHLSSNALDTINLGGATGGTWKYTVNGIQTAALAFGITASALLTAITGLSSVGVGNAIVTAVTGGFSVEFVNALAQEAVTTVADFTALTGGSGYLLTHTQVGTGPTDLAATPVDPSSVSVYVAAFDTGAVPNDSDFAAGQLLRCLEAEVAFADRFSGLMTLDASKTSFSAHVERAPNFTTSLVVEHDSNAISMMADLRAKTTKFCRISMTGDLIEAGFPFRIQVTYPFKLRDPKRGDHDDVYGSTFELLPVYDPVFGGVIEVLIDCDLTAL